MKDWIPSVRVSACAAATVFVLAWVLCAFATTSARAESLESLLPYVIENHDRVKASKSRLTAARNRAREALGAWYPTLSQTANAGHEKQQNDNGSDTSTGFNEWDISLTQLLWDFGSTNAAIDKARLQVEEARYTLIETRQSLILEAITAYLNVIRSNAALGFSKDSEENIRKQTGLEEALVVLGSGFSTDVLQAKTQLAGAQARRAQSEGGLINALNRYQAVFGRMPDDLKALEKVPFPASFLPQSLLQATDIAMETNPSLKNAILASDIAVEDVRIARADNFAPRIEASGERKFKKNVGGTIGSEQETLAKVEMTFDFNLGFTAVNTLRASESDLSATTFTAADTRRNIEEQVRNAWQQLQTAKQTASHLNNQANIAAAFLELARNERQLGRRSLIDVLSGETNLINAKSDAFSAETDVLIAAYGLLAATGLLEYDVIKQSKGIEAPKSQLPPSSPAAETPAAAPTLPVTPATGQQNGEIEPDIAVASGRSVNDFNNLFKKIANPNVAALPDTVITFGRSQSGALLEGPNHPPKPKSRYDSFSDFDTHAETFSPVEPVQKVEFASGNGTDLIIQDAVQTLPASSDTSAAVMTEDRFGDAATFDSEFVDDAAFSNETLAAFEATEVAEIAEVAEAAVSAVPTQTAGTDNGSFLTDLFSFLDAAHQRALDDQNSRDTVQMSETPSTDATSMASVSEAPADTVTEQSVRMARFETAAGGADEVASIPSSAGTGHEAETDTGSDKLGSLVDLFNFLEAAHQRALDDKALNSGVSEPAPAEQPHISAQPSSEKVDEDVTAAPASAPEHQKPSLLSLFDGLLGSEGSILDKIEFEPVVIDPLALSDR